MKFSEVIDYELSPEVSETMNVHSAVVCKVLMPLIDLAGDEDSENRPKQYEHTSFHFFSRQSPAVRLTSMHHRSTALKKIDQRASELSTDEICREKRSS